MSAPKKIALVMHGPIAVVGGVERHNRYLIQLLENLDFEVELFEPSRWLQEKWCHPIFEPLVQYYGLAFDVIKHRRDYDLIVTTGYSGGALSGDDVINICFGTVQSYQKNILRHANWKLRLKNCMIEFFDRKSKMHKKVIAMSQQVQEELLSDYGISSFSIPSGVDTDHFQPQKDRARLRAQFKVPAGKMVGLFVGRWAWNHKGLDLLLPIVQRRTDVQWVFAVDVPLTANNFPEGQIPKNITILPGISFVQLPAVYTLADFSIQLSRYESYGFSLAESLACGTPVISTPMGVAKEIYAEPPLDFLMLPSALKSPAAVIEEAVNARMDRLKDEAFRLRLGEAARTKILGDFSLDRWRSKMRDFIAANLRAAA